MATVIVPVGIVILVILVALFFDFLNGFHDAANSVATIVSTRVLSPRIAVLWAAFFNFVAAFVFGVNVAYNSGPRFPSTTTSISSTLQSWPWDQRCSEDDGNNRCSTIRARVARSGLLRPVLRYPDGWNSHGPWNILRRVANSSNHGHENNKTTTLRGA